MSDLEYKLSEIRKQVGEKVNNWSSKVITGYTPAPEPTRTLGEIWTDTDGKEWRKDPTGKTQVNTTMEQIRMPWFCPQCHAVMNHRLDNRFWRINGFCYNCTIKWHTQMRIDGTWDAYEQTTKRNNEMAYLRDKIAEREAYLREFKVPTVYFEDGRYETLAKLSHFKDMLEEVKRDIIFCTTRLTELETENAHG